MFCYKTKVNEIQCLQLFAVFQKVFLFSPIFCCMMVVSAGRSVTDPFCFLPGLYTYCCRDIMLYVALLFFFFLSWCLFLTGTKWFGGGVTCF